MGVLDDAHRDGVVVGLASETDAPVARQDIDVMLMEQPDTFNLMVIALLELMAVENLPWKVPDGDKVTKDDKFSWFQIAGIHGLPWAMWDGIEAPPVKNPKDDPRSRFNYCVHGTPAFEAWHRPYLAMLEQALYRQVAKVAKRFDDSAELTQEQKEQYREAARKFRLPYLDYFRPRGYQRMIPGVTDFDDPDHRGGLYPRWRGTSKMIRIPYDYSLPQIFTLPRIIVKTLPNNQPKLVQNPFFSFKLPKDALDDSEWKASKLDLNIPEVKDHTMRYGSNKPRSVTQMNDNLCKVHEDQLRMTLSLLDHNGPYTGFVAITTSGSDGIPAEFTDKQGISQSPMGSLEAVHNDFHVYYGGFVGTRMWDTFFQNDPKNPNPDPDDYYGKPDTWAGHMTSVPVAAFDPVFWIHHVQIDRLFAIWQAANPNTWFDDLPGDLKKQGQRELLPFRKSKAGGKDTFWVPDDVEDWTKLGYTYPDLEGDKKSPAEIRERFRYLYAWNVRSKPGIMTAIHQQCPPEMEPLDVSKAQVYQFESGSTEEYIFEKLGPKHDPVFLASTLGITSMELSDEIKNEPIYSWYIDDAVERMALNGSFTIFYIIDVYDYAGKTGGDWVRLPGFVGLTHIFTAPTQACANCEQQQSDKQIVTSTTPITSLLIDYVETGRLKSMAPEDVHPFLVKYLKWRVQTVEGKVIDPRDLSENNQLRISITHTEMPANPDDISWMGGTKKAVNHLDIVKEIIDNAKKTTA